MASPSGHGNNEPWGSIKGAEIIACLIEYYFVVKVSTLYS